MNPDDPSQNPTAGTGASNPLDELLDSVRDHLDDPVPAEDDIPVLTEVVVAAPEATRELNQDDFETGQELLAAAAPDSAPYTDLPNPNPADNTTAEIAETSAAVPVNDLDFVPDSGPDAAQHSEVEEEFEVTQVASLNDAEATQVTDVGQLPEISAQPEFDEPDGGVAEQPVSEWDDGEQFDATQVASLVDEPSAAQPIATRTGDILEPAPFDEEVDDGADTLDGLQQTLVSGIEPSVSTADDPSTETQINAALLTQLDQLIDQRCQNFAQALKQALRDTINPGGNNTKR